MSNNDDMLVKRLSLSKIGDLLKDSLGEEAEDYVFPEDFEKAVVDIGFRGLVTVGNSYPYDAIIIGDVLGTVTRTSNGNNTTTSFKNVRFIGASSVASNSFRYHTELKNVVLNDGITTIGSYAFTSSGVENINFPDSLQSVDALSFYGARITSLVANGLRTIYNANANDAGTFAQCKQLETVRLPKVVDISGGSNTRGIFRGCTALKTVELGSVGYPVTNLGAYVFQDCTQANWTITIYNPNGDYIDSRITNTRSCCPYVTIIMKAANDLVYNGVSYSAGDTIVTSEPDISE